MVSSPPNLDFPVNWRIILFRDVNAAVDYCFSNGVDFSEGSGSGAAASGGNCDESAVKAMFDGMKSVNDMGEEVMDEDAIESWMSQIGVDSSTDVVAILISEYMDAAYMGEYQLSEFKKGCAALGCDSISKWQNIIGRLR